MFSAFVLSHGNDGGKDCLVLRRKSFKSGLEDRSYISQVLRRLGAASLRALVCSPCLVCPSESCCAVLLNSQMAGAMLQSHMKSHMLRFSSADARRQAAANQGGELRDPADLASAFMLSRRCAAQSLDAWYDPLPC